MSFFIRHARADIYLLQAPWEHELQTWSWTPDVLDARRYPTMEEADAVATRHECADVVPAGE